MKKITLLLSGLGVPRHLIQFCVALSRRERCRLTGLFLWTPEKKGSGGHPFPNDINATDADEAVRSLQSGIQVFRNDCREAGLDFTVQTIGDNHFDMLVCDDELETAFYAVHNLMGAPQEAAFPGTVVLAYNGSASSIRAIKQFAYLLPSFEKEKIYLVSVVAPNIRGMEYQEPAGERTTLHFPKAETALLKGGEKEQLVSFINLQKRCLVVMGAFGRNALSRLLKESLALTILKQTDAPLFVTN